MINEVVPPGLRLIAEAYNSKKIFWRVIGGERISSRISSRKSVSMKMQRTVVVESVVSRIAVQSRISQWGHHQSVYNLSSYNRNQIKFNNNNENSNI
ncbi:hypothetical protein M0804_002344 [Polistes exclamans]|nr:hypothetical protein M0804_002344 [Polistes exclamans]